MSHVICKCFFKDTNNRKKILTMLFSNLYEGCCRILYVPDSGLDARRREDLPPVLASGLIIHQDDLPVPSFCTRMNLLCSDKLCRMEF